MTNNLKAFVRSKSPLLSIGIVSADLMHLGRAVDDCEQAGAALLHFDVMDGRFCPQLTAGSFFVKGITTPLLKDVHLMVEDPAPLVPGFARAGADMITVHAESGRHVHYALQLIAEQTNANDVSRQILRGLALNPGTPVAAVEPFLEKTDIICLLAINPGFPKQQFLEATLRRSDELHTLIGTMNDPPLLCIDGGITADTIAKAASTGADIIVSGSAVFKNGAIQDNFNHLNGIISKGK